jgi:hypothetical protein
VGVGRTDGLDPGEGGDQHQQRRLGQVEVGDEGVHDVEAVAWGDEDVGFVGARSQLPGLRRRLLCGGFQCPQAGGADRHHTATARVGIADGVDGGLRQGVALAVHLVLGHIFHPHRLEGAGAHMQRHPGGAHTLTAQRIQHSRVEMQACGRRCHRTGLAGVDGLVARLVVGGRGVLDVGRQRQLAELVEHVEHRLGEAQPGQVVLARHDIDGDRFGELNAGAGLRRVAGADEGQGLEFVQHPFHQQFHPAAAVLLAEQPRLDHPRVVHHQQVVRTQQRRQFAEPAVVQRASRIDMQQAAAAAFGRGELGDQIGGEVEIEVGDTHGARL